MTTTIIQTSFAAGELSPNLYARVDLAKYKVGAALLRNFFVDFRGGASNRPGTQYVSGVKAVGGQPRLLPFIIGAQNSYVLLLGHRYIWFYQNGLQLMTAGVPTEVVTPYNGEDIALLKFTQSADVMTIVHPSYPPAKLTLKDGVFSYAVVTTGPVVLAPTRLTATATNSGDYSYGYVVVAMDADSSEASLPCTPAICKTVILDETKGFQVNLSWTAPVLGSPLYKIYKWGPVDDRQGPPLTVWGYIGSSQTCAFTDNNIAPDFTNEPPDFGDPFSGGQIISISSVNGGSGYPPFTYQPLTFTGSGTGAVGFAIINSQGQVNGAFITNHGKNYSTIGFSVRCGSGGATFNHQISDINPRYPATAGYFDQRAVYGGSIPTPESLDLSQVGNFDNFNTTPVSLASDAIAVDISSTQVNAIKSFQQVSYGLITFTTGGTFLLNGGSPGAAVTPASITAQAQASNGANDMPPIQINYSILYVQNRGNIVRDLSFAWQRQSYTGSDISTFANHLFYNEVLTEWTWCEEPNKLVWVVRQDGILLSLTYVPDQEVFAWARHDTYGYFRSVVSVPEGAYNATYVIVQRLINGALVYYVERFDNRVFDYVEDSWFLDCALATARNSSSTSTLTLSGTAGRVTVTASGGYTFPAEPIVYTLWGPGIGGVYGKATSVFRTDPTHMVVDIVQPFALFPDDLDEFPAPLFPGTWSFDPNVTTVTGLSHLEGKEVRILADGVPSGYDTVVSGTIQLSRPASKVLVGLVYDAQLQTLKLEIDPARTVQGKMKVIPAVTVRVYKTLGIKIGNDFVYLDRAPNFQMPAAYPTQLISDDIRIPVPPDWNVNGQVCILQSDPLPITVLGIIPEILVGDTQR